MLDVAGEGGEEDFGKLRLGRRSRELGSAKLPSAYLYEATTPIMAALSVISFLVYGMWVGIPYS